MSKIAPLQVSIEAGTAGGKVCQYTVATADGATDTMVVTVTKALVGVTYVIGLYGVTARAAYTAPSGATATSIAAGLKAAWDAESTLTDVATFTDNLDGTFDLDAVTPNAGVQSFMFTTPQASLTAYDAEVTAERMFFTKELCFSTTSGIYWFSFDGLLLARSMDAGASAADLAGDFRNWATAFAPWVQIGGSAAVLTFRRGTKPSSPRQWYFTNGNSTDVDADATTVVQQSADARTLLAPGLLEETPHRSYFEVVNGAGQLYMQYDVTATSSDISIPAGASYVPQGLAVPSNSVSFYAGAATTVFVGVA